MQGERTYTANMLACLPRIPLLKSYSTRIPFLRESLFLLTFFIFSLLCPGGQSSTDNPNSIGALGVRYHD